MSAATNISQPEVAVLVPASTENVIRFRTCIGSISRQSLVYFAGTVLATGAGYFFKIYLARTLGAEALGIYALGMTIIGFIGVFNSLGLPTAAARFVAAYSARGEAWRLIGFLRSSLTVLTGLNLVLGALVVIAGPWFAVHFYHAPRLKQYLWAFAIIMILGVLNTFLSQVMAGYRDVARRTIVTHFVATPANIVFAIALITAGFGLRGYLVAQVASALLVTCLLSGLVWRMMPAGEHRAGVWFGRDVVTFSSVAYGIATLQFVLGQADMIIFGHYQDARQVGIYAVATALVGFVSISLDSVNQIFAPMISELHAAGNRAVLQQLYSTLTKWILTFTFPLAITLMVFSHGLMSIFGVSFTSGMAVVVIGAIGQVFNCAVGSVGYLLLMSGNQTELIRIQAVNAVLLVGLNFILVPRIGIAGAAVAMMITTITTNLWGLGSVRRILKIFPYHAGYFKLFLPAMGSAASVLVLARIFADFPKQWQIAGVALVVAYLIFGATILLLGLDDDDRELATLAWSRIGQNFRKMVVA